MNDFKNFNNTKNEKLIQHLTSITEFIDKNKNEWTFENFEKISHYIKEVNKENIKFYNSEEIENLKYKESDLLKKMEQLKLIFQKNVKLNNSNSYVQNLIQENESLKKIGLGLDYKECFIIQNKIKEFVNSYNPISIRFFGKLLGIRDYYVIEMKLKNIINDNLNEKIEIGGTNTFTHLVTTNIKDNWIELPLVKEKEIIESKNVQHLLTGDLNHIIKNKNFEGKERNYLKAIITRITHSNLICPKEFFNLNEGILEENKEYKPNIDEIKDLGNWAYYADFILNCGRCKHYTKNLNEEEIEKLENDDPTKEKLKVIIEENEEDQIKSFWKFRIFGENEIIKNDEENLSYNIVKIYNENWEGSFTYYNLEYNEWNSFYFGYGLKINQFYMPKNLNIIWKEIDDIMEFPEPNPQNPPSEKIETDSELEEEEND